mmetsp:Transcript_8624/g.19888  ORF Transcript_8624/g.19888 Transcript_8624/m.19888 type:complete len:293 (-) Transcript_8624:332-1210(-)
MAGSDEAAVDPGKLEEPAALHLVHISEVLRQSDAEMSSSGTSRSLEEDEWAAALRQVGEAVGDVTTWSRDLFPPAWTTAVFDAMSGYGELQPEAAEEDSESRNSNASESAARSGQGVQEGSSTEEIASARIHQRFDSLASTSLPEAGDEPPPCVDKLGSKSVSPRGLESALLHLKHYKFDSHSASEQSRPPLLVPDLPKVPKELPPPAALPEPFLPEDQENNMLLQEELPWWQRLARSFPACLSCAGTFGQDVPDAEECVPEKVFSCHQICWRMRPQGAERQEHQVCSSGSA